MAAAAVQSCVLQQPVDDKEDEEIINSIISLILYITGYPPVDANHIYRFKWYMDKFLHPCPSMRRNTGGTLPIASSCEPIAESLHGWGDVLPQDLNSVQAVFQFFSVDDQRLAYDVLLRKLGRAPRVLEFFKFLLIFQGQLVLENEKFQQTLNCHLRIRDLLEQLLSWKETLIQALRRSNNQNMKEVDTLQNQKRNLESTIRSIQLKKADLQLEYNALKRRHDQHLAELEDERKDKQQLQADKQALVHSITAHEQKIDRLRDKVQDLGQRLHKESKDKTAILEELSEKSKLVSELEEDREMIELQLSVTISALESTNSDLENRNSDLESVIEQQSVTISALESTNSDLESKNSDLESMTEQQSVTISDLESKNSDLESMTEQQSVTISDLESKNSDLESMTEQQSVTISDLESKNSDLESMTEQQSVTITALETKLQQQNQRQQYMYFILFLAALIFAIVF